MHQISRSFPRSPSASPPTPVDIDAGLKRLQSHGWKKFRRHWLRFTSPSINYRDKFVDLSNDLVFLGHTPADLEVVPKALFQALLDERNALRAQALPPASPANDRAVSPPYWAAPTPGEPVTGPFADKPSHLRRLASERTVQYLAECVSDEMFDHCVGLAKRDSAALNLSRLSEIELMIQYLRSVVSERIYDRSARQGWFHATFRQNGTKPRKSIWPTASNMILGRMEWGTRLSPFRAKSF